jgi:lysozyme
VELGGRAKIAAARDDRHPEQVRAVTAFLFGVAAALVVVLGFVPSARAETQWRERCPGRATVRGIDVSKWQGDVDWKAVRRAGVRFAYVRVSDGTTVLDQTFGRNWREARRAGLLRGAYQYFRPEEDPIEQADLLLATMGAPRAGDLPPALDVEVSGNVTPRELVRRVSRWVARVRRATGLKPIVYTSARDWILLAGNSRRFSSHGLWIAHHDADCPNTPTGWRAWTFHQHSKQGTIAGITGPVDENRFRGTLKALRRMGAKSDRTAARLWSRWRDRSATAARLAREEAAPPRGKARSAP